MSIIYTLIARGNKIILTDLTEYSGNFQQISLVLLNKIKKNKKCTIDYQDYAFYYEDENDLTFLCIVQKMKEEVAFSFLADVKKRFLKRYDMKTISNSFAYQLREFNEEMKSVIKFYEENPNHSKTGVLLNNLSETTEVLRESVEMLLERNEKLNIIAHKSKNLKTFAEDMRTIATDIRKRERRDYLKWVLLAVGGVLLLCLFLYLILK